MFAFRLLPFCCVNAQSSIMSSSYQILNEMKSLLRKQLIVSAIWMLSATSLVAQEVTVFAASSLRDALGTVAAEYERETGVKVVMVFAASSAVARQVAQGAPADVVLLADEEWGAWLVDQGVVEQVEAFIGNRLVLIGKGIDPVSQADLATLLDGQLIAMAQTDAVPAGRYGQAALLSLGLWDRFEPHVVQAANVRAALRFVERGEVLFAIGYASDLVALPELSEIYSFAPDSHPMIVYSGADLTPQGENFMAYLQSVTAQNILGDWGFAPLLDTP
ncbi:Molybdate-binding protein ModA [Nymphon striatum]|nr:Molybdate-binding protein ModA [Nymphon striatum]